MKRATSPRRRVALEICDVLNLERTSMKYLVIALSVLSLSSFANAADLSKACKKEVKTFACKGGDHEIHECLESHEEHGKKNDGFSKACYDAHEAYEKKAGKSEGAEAEEHK